MMSKMHYILLIGVIMWHGIAADKELTEAGNILKKFSPTLFKAIAEGQTGDLVCSPISLWMTLALTSAGARGTTEKILREKLGLPEDKKGDMVRSSGLIDHLKIYNAVELRMSNDIFLDQKFTPKVEFTTAAIFGFQSNVRNVNFRKSDEARQTINGWCEARTNNKIKELIKPGVLGPDTVMVLTNAIYFKGEWAEKFDPANTTNRPFHISIDRKVDVPTMFRSGQYNWNKFSKINATAIAIPYKVNDKRRNSDEVNMIIIMPNEVDGLPKLENTIDNNLSSILDGIFEFGTGLVNLYLPKFKIESEYNLAGPLGKMGLGSIFDKSADFSGISDNNLEVSSVIQKAFIEVNEEGTEAAAATEFEFANRIFTSTHDFVVDRPFLLLITLTNMESSEHVPIFMARYTGQNEKQSESGIKQQEEHSVSEKPIMNELRNSDVDESRPSSSLDKKIYIVDGKPIRIELRNSDVDESRPSSSPDTKMSLIHKIINQYIHIKQSILKMYSPSKHSKDNFRN